MQQRVTGAIRDGAGALHRFLTEVRRMTAEWTLVERAVVVAIERHPEMLELVDDLGRVFAHVLDRVLVTQPVGALDRVVHMPQPTVFGHVAKRCTDATLRSDRMRARRKHLRQHGHRQARFGKLQRRAHPGTACANDDGVEAHQRQALRQSASALLDRLTGTNNFTSASGGDSPRPSIRGFAGAPRRRLTPPPTAPRSSSPCTRSARR